MSSSSTWCCYHGDCRKVLFLPCVIKVVLNVFIDVKCYFRWELAEFGCVLYSRHRYTICTQKVQQSRKQITTKLPKPNLEQLTGAKQEPAEHTIWQTHRTHHGLSQLLLPVCGKLWNLQLASGEFRSPETRIWISFSPNKVGSGPQFRVNLPNLTCFPLLCVLPVFSSYSVLTPCRCWQVKLHLLVCGILGNGVPIKHHALISWALARCKWT